MKFYGNSIAICGVTKLKPTILNVTYSFPCLDKLRDGFCVLIAIFNNEYTVLVDILNTIQCEYILLVIRHQQLWSHMFILWFHKNQNVPLGIENSIDTNYHKSRSQTWDFILFFKSFQIFIFEWKHNFILSDLFLL